MWAALRRQTATAKPKSPGLQPGTRIVLSKRELFPTLAGYEGRKQQLHASARQAVSHQRRNRLYANVTESVFGAWMPYRGAPKIRYWVQPERSQKPGQR